jgi:hypothetical protein
MGKMNIFEIQGKLEDLYKNLIGEDGQVDPEVLAEFEKMSMAKDEKIENTALYVKQLAYEVQALQEEKRNIDSRIRQKRNTAEFLKGLLDDALEGHKFETPKAKVSFRKTTKVDVEPAFIQYAQGKGLVDLLEVKISQTPKKAEIKKALQNGEQLEHCHLITDRSVIVK